VLVLSDAFYPGWTAEVDGMLTEILPANVAGRAVPLGPGHHRVGFRYHTPGLAVGARVSGAGWLAVAVLGLCSRRKRSLLLRPSAAT